MKHHLAGLLIALTVAAFAAPALAREKGRNARASELRAVPLPRPSGHLHIITQHHDELRVDLYRPDGSYDQQALAALDWLFRDRRHDRVASIDPRLYEMLSIIQDHFEGRPIMLGSAFRIERITSRHRQASACDFHIQGVSYRELFQYATSLDLGGMGMGRYPRGGYIHLDFRAPGAPSYRWIDHSPPERRKSRKHRNQPTS